MFKGGVLLDLLSVSRNISILCTFNQFQQGPFFKPDMVTYTLLIFWPLNYFPIVGQNIHWAADTWCRNCKWWTSATLPFSNASPWMLFVMTSCNSPRWSMWSSTETLLGTTTFLRSPLLRQLANQPAQPWMPLPAMGAHTIVMIPVPTKVQRVNILPVWLGH